MRQWDSHHLGGWWLKNLQFDMRSLQAFPDGDGEDGGDDDGDYGVKQGGGDFGGDGENGSARSQPLFEQATIKVALC